MRRFQRLTLMLPVLSALSCNDATGPQSPGSRDAGELRRSLLTPATNPHVIGGGFHTCALKGDGMVACWGNNAEGATTVPDGLSSVAQLSAGYIHTCALKTDGTVVCWGDNAFGQATVPVALASVAQVSAGGRHTCALVTDGTVSCWGYAGFGNVPNGLGSVAQISAGADHTCALKGDQTITCWGFNGDGQTNVPAGLGPSTQVSASGNHTCALEADGTVTCWGYNGLGESDVPAGLTSVAYVAAGNNHTCALTDDGVVVCWGYDADGQANVPGELLPVGQLAAGGYHTCALQDDGTVDCWGNNSAGQASVPPGLDLDVGDVTAPLTTVNSAVDGSGARMVTGAETLSSDIAITFSGTDDVGIMEFQCSLDSASYVACSSPITHSALLVGAHTFLVTAVDGAGNVSVPASFTWTVVTPARAVNNLIISIAGMGLPAGVTNSLSAPLNNFNASNPEAACGKLNAFLNQVAASVENGKLTVAQSAQLLEAANAIRNSVGCE